MSLYTFGQERLNLRLKYKLQVRGVLEDTVAPKS